MKYLKLKWWVIVLLTAIFLPLAVWSAESLPHPDQYLPHTAKFHELKKITDDHTDLIDTYPVKNAVPQEIYNALTFEVEEAIRQTEDILGFKSPDLVDKIAPQIKPGKYTYKDLEKYPKLKELFIPEMLQFIKPGGPPLTGCIPKFEIVPTRQLDWFLRLCEMTKKNLGKTRLDKEGYIVPLSWHGGFPFPRPSGKFKAQQLYYNFEKRVVHYDMCYASKTEGMSFDQNLTRDKYIQNDSLSIRFMGRTLFPPYGWFDEDAKRNGEFQSYATISQVPRNLKGTVLLNHKYGDPNKMNQWMIYVPSLRRIRKMNPTDTQDPSGDTVYDDIFHISQKITSKKYPYKFEIIAEREYLMPIQYNRASLWIDSKNGYALRGIQFMRRPCYVLQMTQLDPNYIYSKRIIYIDKETFMSPLSANYDQKQQLYRTQISPRIFMSETGQICTYGTYSLYFDHVDLHSTFYLSVAFPAPFGRKEFTIQYMINRGK